MPRHRGDFVCSGCSGVYIPLAVMASRVTGQLPWNTGLESAHILRSLHTCSAGSLSLPGFNVVGSRFVRLLQGIQKKE